MFTQIGIADIFDIAFVTLLVYLLLVWFKRTRAAFVLTGIIIIALVYLLAQQFGLELTAGVFQGFFAVILIALIVIFQEEIRRFFEQVALWSMNPTLRRNKDKELPHEEVQTIVKTLSDLSNLKTGALIVMPGLNTISGHTHGGIDLHGRVSEPLLKSLFDPHSVGHDGAVVIEGTRVTLFCVHLPLSTSHKNKDHPGTRHAAALGLAERTDAMIIVASEETGSISVARHGNIREMPDAATLLQTIERFYRELHPRKEVSWKDIFRRNFKEKVIALAIAILLWFSQVYGSQVIYKTIDIPVDFAELPSKLEIVSSDPKEIEVTLSGPRKSLHFIGSDDVRLYLTTLHIQEGSQNIRISASDLSYPQELKVENIQPGRVRVDVEGKGEKKGE